ncbi:MAG: hypothetical protein FJX25_17245 [Alphaproteobacteria bacterium]|nr:hypothetical protein [Alphaproteobacteria bacterium]
MLTRNVFFEGKALIDDMSFRRQIAEELLPLWQAMPNSTGTRLTFAGRRDADAPEILMVLSVDYPDHAALEASRASDHRNHTRDRSTVVLASSFHVRIHHHVTCSGWMPAHGMRHPIMTLSSNETWRYLT